MCQPVAGRAGTDRINPGNHGGTVTAAASRSSFVERADPLLVRVGPNTGPLYLGNQLGLGVKDARRSGELTGTPWGDTGGSFGDMPRSEEASHEAEVWARPRSAIVCSPMGARERRSRAGRLPVQVRDCGAVSLRHHTPFSAPGWPRMFLAEMGMCRVYRARAARVGRRPSRSGRPRMTWTTSAGASREGEPNGRRSGSGGQARVGDAGYRGERSAGVGSGS